MEGSIPDNAAAPAPGLTRDGGGTEPDAWDARESGHTSKYSSNSCGCGRSWSGAISFWRL
ncbi:hypothetical protein SALBM217S_04678 [Streptomyces griseoloalbus]